MNNKENHTWDVVVIGGGPAGMMAAGRAAELGRSVLLLEKNPTLGKKLLMTGGGRCNVTNNKRDIRTIAAQYKGSSQFLMSAFSQFDVVKTLDFFNSRGMATKEEAEGRIFPSSNKSRTVLDVLVKYMNTGGVKVKVNAAVADFSFDKKKEQITLQLKGGEILTARSCVVATGGTSHPETGSTGEGFSWLKKIGHAIVKNNFALVPIAIQDVWVKKLSGVTLNDIKLTILQDGKKHDAQKGKLLFTHFGISGPTVLNMSKDVGELIAYGDVVIMLDLFPKLDNGTLKQNLQNILITESNKKLKNVLGELIPSAFVPAILAMAGIDGETANHSVRREDRIKLVAFMKTIPMYVKGLLGADKAIVSSGGVALEEINFKTMQSRIVPQVYVIGDALNVNRPSGGYSLQLCWTTGFVAGNSA
ncbi:MAG: aminoacetone oxidase family FAD-binding enzyme [Candidatus Jorgensenbacteria bacterium]|nr:aminoacetone oxidase family FAD-binding enzyme [Candidatus Jorgensenbacteria bacterium]